MPSPIETGGFNIPVMPQYNPGPAQDYVVNRSAGLQGLGQGLDLFSNIAAYPSTLGARVATAKLQAAKAQSDMGQIQALADARLAQANADKKIANLASQRADYTAEQLDNAHQILTSTGLGNIPIPASAGNPTFTNTQAPFVQSPSPNASAQAILPGWMNQMLRIPAQSGGAGGTPQLESMAAAPNITAQQQVTPSTPSWNIPAQAQTGTTSAVVSNLTPNDILNQKLEKIALLMTPDEAVDMARNISVYQHNPVAQAQVAKVYSDIQEAIGHGDYWNAMATWRNAEAKDLVQGGGRNSPLTQVLKGFSAAGGNLLNVIDLPAYNEAVVEAVNNGGTPDEVRLTDFVDMDKLKAENERINQAQQAKTDLATAKATAAQNKATDADLSFLGAGSDAARAPGAGGAAIAPTAQTVPATPAAPMRFGKRPDGTYGLIPANAQ